MAFDVSSIFAQQVQAVSRSDTGRELRQVDIDELVGNDANFYAVDEDKLDELKNSIALSGIMDPPTVTPAEDGKYRLISGHRRTAAVRALVAEGREDLRKMPVFVRNPKSAAMEELELIMANSTARVLTSAEISQAAQRVERLLYDLKEQGVEFPGRMRDHVAEACNVSKTKLANLHMIEENLIQDFKTQWAAGKLPDATALELARCEVALQMRLHNAFARTKEFPTSVGIAKVRELAEQGAKWRPDACLHCPDGQSCPTSRDDATLRHDALCPAWGGRCLGTKCCMDCPSGANAQSWNTCDQMCARAKQYRADKNADEKQKEEDAKEKTRRVYRAGVQRKAARLVKAIDAAGLPDDTKLTFANYAADKTVEKIRAYANGDFGDDYFYGTDSLDPDAKHVPELCEKLHCSADYLLGLTEELQPVSKSDTLPWRTGTDYPDGKILFLFDDAGNLSYQVSEARHGRIRIFSDYDDGEILRWLPLPPEEEGTI
jgi:ParB family chromosome partitioning protein